MLQRMKTCVYLVVERFVNFVATLKVALKQNGNVLAQAAIIAILQFTTHAHIKAIKSSREANAESCEKYAKTSCFTWFKLQ